MKSFKYSNRPKSYITVKVIDDPYGSDDTNSMPVVSVGCTLKADFSNPTWKVHIPIDLAHSVGKELMSLAQQHMPSPTGGSRGKVKFSLTEPRVPKKKAPGDPEPTPGQNTERALAEGRVVRRKRREEK